MLAPEKGGILFDGKMVENVPPDMTEWKIIAPEKNRIVQDWRMAENVSLENDYLGK